MAITWLLSTSYIHPKLKLLQWVCLKCCSHFTWTFPSKLFTHRFRPHKSTLTCTKILRTRTGEFWQVNVILKTGKQNCVPWGTTSSSGSRNFGGGGPRNMKYKPPRMVAIFFGLFFTGQGGAWPPCPPPGSTTDQIQPLVLPPLPL